MFECLERPSIGVNARVDVDDAGVFVVVDDAGVVVDVDDAGVDGVVVDVDDAGVVVLQLAMALWHSLLSDAA